MRVWTGNKRGNNILREKRRFLLVQLASAPFIVGRAEVCNLRSFIGAEKALNQAPFRGLLIPTSFPRERDRYLIWALCLALSDRVIKL